MKTKEELDALKVEVETLNKKLAELNDEELEQIIGGSISTFDTMWITSAVPGGSGNQPYFDPSKPMDIDINKDNIIYMDVDTIPNHQE